MSLRDKRRKQSRQHVSVEATNLEAIAQTIPETKTQPTTPETGEDMSTNNNAPVRIMGETESSPGLDAVVNQLPIIPLTEINQKEEETMNTNNNTPVEVELTEDQVVDTTEVETTDELKTATEEQRPGFEILTEWLGTFEPPKPENLVGLNLHTLTGASLVAALGMPNHIPVDVVDILLEEMKTNPMVGNYHGVAEKIVKMYTTDAGVGVAEVIDFGLPLARPFVVTKTKPILALLNAIQSFLQPPAAVQANVVEEASVEVKATDKPVTATIAAENKTINVTVTVSDTKANAEVEETKEAEVAPVVKGPEDLLAEWVLNNPNYTFDQYFNKRNELYLTAA